MKRLLAILGLIGLLPFLTGSAIVINPYRYVTAGGGTPTVSSASIESSVVGLTTLLLNFSESCTNGAGGSGGVTVSPSGGASTAAYSSGSPSATFSYTLTRQILSSETVTRSYTQPTNGIEATTGGTDLASFSAQSVTNNSKNVALDDFNRANSGTLGANWTDSLAGIGIVSNEASGTGVNMFFASDYTATTPSANCRASVTLQSTPSGVKGISIYIRYESGTGNGYSINCDGTTISIDEETGYSGPTLNSGSVTFVSGDILSAEIVGSNIAVYKNGVSVLTTSSGTYTIARPIGISIQSSGGGTQTFAFDNFVLQNL